MQLLKFLAIVLLSLLLPEQCKCFFRENYKKMVNTAKNYYKSNFQKDKTWHFLGYDLSEYPGTKKEYGDINHQKWHEYYSCLQIQHDNLGPHQSVIPEAVQGFEGGSVHFDCKICLNPRERDKIDAVEWFWAPLNAPHLTEVEYTEHILLTPEDKTLSLYNLQEDQTGQYMCKLGGSLTAPYFLTVVNSATNASEVHTKFAKNGPLPTNPDYIMGDNLILDTQWGDWSLCSTCGTVGKRHKFGYCVIIIPNQTTFQLATTSATTSDNKTTTNAGSAWHQIFDNMNVIHRNRTKTTNKKFKTEVLAKDLEILTIFQNGIPCLSHILPDSIKKIIEERKRTNEIMTGYCKVPCPNNAIFEVRDKDGKVIERANNSAGIYSMMQGLPPVEPPVGRLLQYENIDQHIVISCPGNLNTDTPIQWQLGSKKLLPELIAQQSMGRIYISVLDKVNIRKAKIADSNIYSCWQNNELAGTVRLVVEKKVKMNFNHHVMLLGMVIILSVFLYVVTRAFHGRKYARITK